MKKIIEGVKFLAAIALVALVAVLSMKFMAAAGMCLAVAFIGWPDANLSNLPLKRGDPSRIAGAETYELLQPWTKLTTDGDGTIYYIALISADAVFTALELLNAALAGCTSVDIGLYRLDRNGVPVNTAAGAAAGSGGAKSDGSDAGALFASAVDINAGNAAGSPKNMMLAVSIANTGKKLWELLGFTDPKLMDSRYVLGVRLNTAGAATGALALKARYAQG
jgi:hypothetical protein